MIDPQRSSMLNSKAGPLWAAALIGLGLLAAILPVTTGVFVSVIVRSIAAGGALAFLALAMGARGTKIFVPRLVIGIVYAVVAAIVVADSGLSYRWMCLLLALAFLVESITEFVAFAKLRGTAKRGWVLFGAIMALVLAYAICLPLTSSTAWYLGTVLGLKLAVSGLSRMLCSPPAQEVF